MHIYIFFKLNISLLRIEIECKVCSKLGYGLGKLNITLFQLSTHIIILFSIFKDMSSTEPIITIEDGHLPTENSAIMIEDDVLQEDEGGGGGDEHAGQQEQAEVEVTPFQTRKRKKTSAAWLEFKVINAFTAKCNWCKRNMATKPGGPTTTLIRHLKGCAMRQLNDKSQKRLNVNKPSAEPISSPENFVYDHAKVREAAAHMILIHEHPFNHMEHEMFNIFMRTVSPYWKKISRATVKQDCVSTYEIEKKKIEEFDEDCWED